jgi:hypothetical protein
MKKTKLAVMVLTALCTVAFGSEAFAKGGSGQGARLRDGSCVKNKTATSSQNRVQTQQKQGVQDGSGDVTDSSRQGTGKGQKRRLGPGDGTGNAVPPQDGTGYGSPANR